MPPYDFVNMCHLQQKLKLIPFNYLQPPSTPNFSKISFILRRLARLNLDKFNIPIHAANFGQPDVISGWH